jgi:FtsP/CotA-like multicopper oxidase with cupredoxin domain
MSKRSTANALGRRRFMTMAGKAAVAATGMGVLPVPLKKLMGPLGVSEAQAQAAPGTVDLFYAGTDGWISLPKAPAIVSPALGLVHPDNLAPGYPDSGFTTYIFGFRDVTGLTDTQRSNQKNKAQHSAPMFWVDQFDPANPKDFKVQLTNLGLALRPDLFDAHTIHWHGFRNVITFFDGEPTGSVAVMTGRFFTYVYRPRDPGTYMFHCHVEDTEHVHMGMTGPVFVRPLQNGNTTLYPSGKYAYNDGDGSTGYDREYAMFCSEVWCDSHWADAHIQLPEWTDYRADFSLLNGRVWPDTIAPSSPISVAGSVHSRAVQTDASGDLVVPAGHDHLQYQPLSALVTCNAGERVLLRFANLGFREAAMTLAGIRMKVVGKDATPMRGRDGTDTSYGASTVSFGAGESIDAIFTAPAFTGGSGSSGQGYDVYVLYDRAYERSNNLASTGSTPYGGRRTEVRVYPPGGLAAQAVPNHNPGTDPVV